LAGKIGGVRGNLTGFGAKKLLSETDWKGKDGGKRKTSPRKSGDEPGEQREG